MAEALIETARLRLGRVTVADADLMLAVWNDPAFVANVMDRGIRTLEQAEEAVRAGPEKLFKDHGYGPYWVELSESGDRIGICGLFKRDNLDVPDIGFALLPDYVGKGYAGEAAVAVRDYARDVLGMTRLAAIVSPGNAPSVGVIRKLGMAFESDFAIPDDEKPLALYSMTFEDPD